ncbi:hypothetical protein HHK36_017583 [Tetracentron sinense]|uniref:Uncharacterized protein n=1 Tax=Tetracentron sinense TaxID=13715 RepID=A0A835DCQ9_TETSI|nr:hypothetical protein HHK36_017583 [Tetracentron sinense]
MSAIIYILVRQHVRSCKKGRFRENTRKKNSRNCSCIPVSNIASPTFRCDQLDKESLKVMYVSTDSVQGATEFEMSEREDMILCGYLEDRNGQAGLWIAIQWPQLQLGRLPFFRSKLGISLPSIEVVVAGCCSGVPLMLTRTLRQKHPRHGALDSIPEDEEAGKEQKMSILGMGHLMLFQRMKKPGRKRRRTSLVWFTTENFR